MIRRALCWAWFGHEWRRGHRDEGLELDERICSRCKLRRLFAHRATW